MLQLIIQRCGVLFDRLDSDANHHKVERLVVALSAVGFLIHLLLICLARSSSRISREPWWLTVTSSNHIAEES